ncbi:MAG: protein kinase [Bacteroidota bacterium]
MNIAREFSSINTSIIRLICAALVFGAFSCTSKTNNERPYPSEITTWYRQATVDLGARIIMFSPDDGIAISRGMGKEVKGKVYRFHKGQWLPFYEYPYSDYPLIAGSDSIDVWTVNHRTHEGAYQPIQSTFLHGVRKEVPIPKIMWDDIDYVMFKGIHRYSDGTAWMVGQQGHILHYDGGKWKEVESPLINPNRTTAYDGDLNDVVMTSKNSGWAVGRNGVIIRYDNTRWEKIESPTNQTLQKISMVNDSTGWAVGNSGTILICRNYQWQKVSIDIREQLFSVFTLDEQRAWIVGNNSTLLSYDGSSWRQDESIKNYDDLFSDISVVKDSAGKFHLWVIGNQGIYTTSQSLGFSFTDITNQAGLRRAGKLAHFFFRSNQYFPDLLVANDGGTSLLYENNGSDLFSDVTSETNLLAAPRDAMTMAVGDVNNDGEDDILQLVDNRNFKFYLGTTAGGFRDFSERSMLNFAEINPLVPNSAKFVDLNNDGNLDLYISNYDLPDQIFLGDGSGTFSVVTTETGINKVLNHASYGAVFGDFNNDRLTDIFIPYYVSSKTKFFSLFLNNGGMRFSEKDDSLFYSQTDLSPTAIALSDFNNDGNIDLFIHSQKIPPMVWTNYGNGSFKDVSQQAGFTQLINHPEPINGIVGTGDVNNDGWVDIFAGSKLFLNSPQFTFSEVSERVGIQFVGTPSLSDIDDDGDLDMFIGSSRASLGKGDRAVLFRNNLNEKNYIKIKIVGDESNRSSIGAKIVLRNTKGEIQSRVVGSGGNQLTTQNVNQIHFGVMPDEKYSIKIIFPSGNIQESAEVSSGVIVTFSESNFVTGRLIDWRKSIQRNLSLLSLSSIIQKCISLGVVLWIIFIIGRKIGAQKIMSRWYFVVSVVILFLILVHISVYESEIASTTIAFLGTSGISVIFLFLGHSILKKREASFISHYRLMELLGSGGMGKVYKAIDTNTKQIVALKVLNPELLKDPENRRRLSAEGHMLASFNHPNIVKVFEIGESSERGYIAMEYLNGGTLRERLEKEHPLSIHEIKRYLLQVCDGLSEVHGNDIIHRDLKTGNLMLGADGNLRIMDFGLSKSPLVTTMTSLGTVLGTLGYVAPEQVTSLNVDRRTDIFSLGVVMYELLTKELPFKGENEIALIHSIFNTVPPSPSHLRDGLPGGWDEIVAKCLAKDMNDRFATTDEVKTKIQHL